MSSKKSKLKAASKAGKPLKTKASSKLKGNSSKALPIVAKNINLNDVAVYASAALKTYGSYVVEDRAVPEFRDGLKPVHRAILWAMYELKLQPTGKPKKAARIVGDALGKYHPHGDQACYDAAVTLANTKPNIIKGQGNWGGPADGAAAMRYCFASGTRIMTDQGLIEIDKMPSLLGEDPDDYLYTDKFRVDMDLEVSSLKTPLPMSHWINSGVHETFKIKTRHGFEVVATANQPFYTLNGVEYEWKDLQDLNVGDPVCIQKGNAPEVEAGKSLPEFDFELKTTAVDYTLPTEMSDDLAFVLGALVAEGYAHNGIGFNNTNKTYWNKFNDAWMRLFPDTIPTITMRDAHGYGNKRSKYFHVGSKQIEAFFEDIGMVFGSHNQVIPECIFRSSKSEVITFISALFEGDGSVCNRAIQYHSKSNQLLKDIQNVLVNYLGVPSVVYDDFRMQVTGAQNVLAFLQQVPFVSARKKTEAKVQLKKAKESLGKGNTLNDLMPDSTMTYMKDFLAEHKVSPKVILDESGNEHVLAGDSAGATSIFARTPKVKTNFDSKIKQHSEKAKTLWPELTEKLLDVVDCDYLYDTIVSIEPMGDQWVYDLTVPSTHAFVANGFIAHNTEATISEFTKAVLLDSEYIKAVKMIDNYSMDERIPLILPALLPILLIIGNPTAPAYGIRAGNPPFALEGIIKLIQLGLKKPITDAMCMKYLKVSYPTDCLDVTEPENYKNFIKTGRGSLKLCPRLNADWDKKQINILSFAPGFRKTKNSDSIESCLEKIRNLKGVSSAENECGTSNPDAGPLGACFVIKPARGTTENDFFDMAEKIQKILTSSESFQLGITMRKDAETTNFCHTSYAKFFNNWIKYRVQLERSYIKVLQNESDQRIRRLVLLMFAIDYRKHLQATANSKAKDLDADLLKRIKKHIPKNEVPLDFCKALLNLTTRQTANLEKKTLKDKLSEEKTIQKGLGKDLKSPTPRVAKHLKSMTGRVKKLLEQDAKAVEKARAAAAKKQARRAKRK